MFGKHRDRTLSLFDRVYRIGWLRRFIWFIDWNSVLLSIVTDDRNWRSGNSFERLNDAAVRGTLLNAVDDYTDDHIAHWPECQRHTNSRPLDQRICILNLHAFSIKNLAFGRSAEKRAWNLTNHPRWWIRPYSIRYELPPPTLSSNHWSPTADHRLIT